MSCVSDTSLYNLILEDPGHSIDTIKVKIIINLKPNPKIFLVNNDYFTLLEDTLQKSSMKAGLFASSSYPNSNFCRTDSFHLRCQINTINPAWNLSGVADYSDLKIALSSQLDALFKVKLSHSGTTISRAMVFKSLNFNNHNGYFEFKTTTYHDMDSAGTRQEAIIGFRVCIKDKREKIFLNDPSIRYCEGDRIMLDLDRSAFSNIMVENVVSDSFIIADKDYKTLTAIDQYGCTVRDTLSIDIKRPNKEKLCLVTLDSLTNKNAIIYDKTLAKNTKSYRIYKQGSVLNQYELIAERAFSEPNIFIDNSSQPDAYTEYYKVSAVDSCDNESVLSEFHKTMHLSVSQGLNNKIELRWDPYEGLTYPSINIYRGTDRTTLNLLSSRPGNSISYTEVSPPGGLLYYQLEIVAPNVCEIKRSNDFVVSSKSNIERGMTTAVEKTHRSNYDVQRIASKTFRFAVLDGDENSLLMIYDVLGHEIYRAVINNTITDIDLNHLPVGVLSLKYRGRVSKILNY
ncbi:MAG TPA: hypothetical protein PK006_10025 [Saprospiraceae bacterium]|nr:hypothetical protein [Saprospiraceae bacterium]